MRNLIKKCVCVLTAMLLCASLLPLSVSAAEGLGNFKKTNTWSDGMFTDVGVSDWFYEDVKSVYEHGLMIGKSDTSFDPEGELTAAEAATLAMRLHAVYHSGAAVFPASDPWYLSYVTYMEQNGILFPSSAHIPPQAMKAGEIKNYSSLYAARATRYTFASLISSSLPDEALQAINTVEDGAIPDVYTSTGPSEPIYRLYRAGILTGSDAEGSFRPEETIRRCEVAAIIARVADPSLRKNVSLKAPVLEGPLTKELVVELVGKKEEEPVQFVALADFDGDGTAEAFAVAAPQKNISEGTVVCSFEGTRYASLWFVSGGRADLISREFIIMIDSPDYLYDDWGELKIFRYSGMYSWTSLWIVEDGSPVWYELPDYEDVIVIPGYDLGYSQKSIWKDAAGRGYLVYNKNYGGAEDGFYGHPETRYSYRLYQLNPDTMQFEWTMVKTSAKTDWKPVDLTSGDYDAASLMGDLMYFDLDE